MYLHAWIETKDMIIDPTLAVSSGSMIQEGLDYYPIIKYSAEVFIDHLREKDYTGEVKRDLELSWDDPRVESLGKKIDPP